MVQVSSLRPDSPLNLLRKVLLQINQCIGSGRKLYGQHAARSLRWDVFGHWCGAFYAGNCRE